MTARSSANSCGKLPAASQIALETSGSYYWMVEEMEQAGHQPRLALALTAERRMQGRHKTKREGCPRIGHAARQWNPAGRLDSPGRIRRPAGVAGGFEFSVGFACA
jgi:hypothetical protein